MSRVVVIGSVNVDFIMKLSRLPQMGETVTDGQFSQTFGGKGANQAAAAARMGAETLFVGCVGSDEYGQGALAALEAAGVNTRHCRRSLRRPTGAALVMIGEAGANYLAVAPGSNHDLCPDDVPDGLLRAGDEVLLQMEAEEELNAWAIAQAKRAGARIHGNYAPAHRLDSALRAGCDFLSVNEAEAGALCGRSIHTAQEAHDAALELLHQGPKAVIITLGAQGAVVADDTGERRSPPFQVGAVDTTAAGDTFAGALAAAMAEGMELDPAVRLAQAAAAISTTRLGAQPSIPRRDEVDSFLEAHA